MNPSTIKNFAGIFQLILAVGVQFIPAQYQNIVLSLIAALAGGHAITAGTTNK